MLEPSILLCEDDKALSSLIKFKLIRAGYAKVDIAEDGKVAKDMIRNNQYDLVISDIHMPFASGLELTTFIREELQSQIPILILSSEGIEDTILQGFDLGINDFITKPFSPQELVVRVKKHLKT